MSAACVFEQACDDVLRSDIEDSLAFSLEEHCKSGVREQDGLTGLFNLFKVYKYYKIMTDINYPIFYVQQLLGLQSASFNA